MYVRAHVPLCKMCVKFDELQSTHGATYTRNGMWTLEWGDYAHALWHVLVLIFQLADQLGNIDFHLPELIIVRWDGHITKRLLVLFCSSARLAIHVCDVERALPPSAAGSSESAWFAFTSSKSIRENVSRVGRTERSAWAVSVVFQCTIQWSWEIRTHTLKKHIEPKPTYTRVSMEKSV